MFLLLYIAAVLLAVPLQATDKPAVNRPNFPSLNLRIELDRAHALQPHVLGANVESWYLPGKFSDPAFSSRYREAGQPCLRYPGGTGANFFDPTTGFFIPAEPWVERYTGLNRKLRADYGDKGFDTGDFFAFAKNTPAAYSLVLNLSTVPLDKNRTWMQRLKVGGADVRFVEMGNEVYFGNYKAYLKDGADYVAKAKDTAAMVKEFSPQARIGVVIPCELYRSTSAVSATEIAKDKRQVDWIQALRGDPFFDAVVIHLYSDVGMTAGVEKEGFLPYPQAYQSAISHVDNRLEATLQVVRELFPGKAIWVTEYNIWIFGGETLRSYRIARSHIGALHNDLLILKLFGRSDVELSNWHALNSFFANHNLDVTTVFRHVEFLSKAIRAGNQYAPVQVSGAGHYEGLGQRNGQFPEVEAACFVKGDQAWLVLLNKLATTYQLGKCEVESGGQLAGATILTCDQLLPAEDLPLPEALEQETKVTVRSCPPETFQNLQLPPYSMTRLKLKLDRASGNVSKK